MSRNSNDEKCTGPSPFLDESPRPSAILDTARANLEKRHTLNRRRTCLVVSLQNL